MAAAEEPIGQAELGLRRTSRVLRTICRCNHALIRATDQRELLREVCRIVVDVGAYPLAWVGFAEADKAKTVRPIAQAGFEEGHLETLNITWADTESGGGPTSTAIRTGQPVIARSIPTDPVFSSRREAAMQGGCTSSIALPLVAQGQTFGALMICSKEPDAFDAPEVVLLKELASDLAYGLSVLRMSRERALAEEAVRIAHQQLVDIIELLPDATFVIDMDKRVIAWNRACETMTGVKKDAVLGRGDYAYAEPFFGDRRPILIDLLDMPATELDPTYYKLVRRDGGMIYSEAFNSRLKGGQGVYLWAVAAPLFDREGRRCGAIEAIRDVTEYRRAEEALQSVFKAAPVGICIMKDRVLQKANDLWYEIIGYTEAEMLGQTTRQLYESEQEYQRVGRELCAGPPQRGVISLESKLRRGDGAFRDVILSAALLNPSDPSAGEVVAVYDVTERNRAEEARRESERKYQELVEHANSIILRWTHDGRITFLNKFGQRFFGYSAEEIIGRHVMGTIVPATDSVGRDLRQLMDQVLADPLAFEQNVNENMRRNGERVWIAWTNRIVRDVQGQVAEIQSVGTDITALKRAEEALRQSEEQFRLIMDNLADLVAVLDLDGRRLYNSPSYQSILGDPGNLRGSSSFDQVHPEDRTRVQRAFEETVRTGVGQRLEYRMVDQSGRARHIESQGSVIRDAQGRVSQVLVVSRDVTERRRVEEAVRELNVSLEQRVAARTAELAVARDRAEAADRLKSAFLATMSHELRTPLNSIIGFTGIILQGLAGPLNAEQRRQLEMVRDSARHLLALINDVLDISKIEAGQLEVSSEPFDLRASILKVGGIVKPLAEKKGLDLRVVPAPEIGTVVSDSRRVEQVLLNLLNNAIKFTERGAVTLTAGIMPGGSCTSDSTIRICVSDTGIGIKPEDLAKLFQSFRQVHSGLSRQHEGTGLGLAICRRLAELLGGEVHAASDWGKGSVFTFTLPMKGPGTG